MAGSRAPSFSSPPLNAGNSVSGTYLGFTDLPFLAPLSGLLVLGVCVGRLGHLSEQLAMPELAPKQELSPLGSRHGDGRLQAGEEVIVTRANVPVARHHARHAAQQATAFRRSQGPIPRGRRLRRATCRLRAVHGMNLLLDTHAFLWFMEGSERTSQGARAEIEAADGVRALSVASAWGDGDQEQPGRTRPCEAAR